MTCRLAFSSVALPLVTLAACQGSVTIDSDDVPPFGTVGSSLWLDIDLDGEAEPAGNDEFHILLLSTTAGLCQMLPDVLEACGSVAEDIQESGSCDDGAALYERLGEALDPVQGQGARQLAITLVENNQLWSEPDSDDYDAIPPGQAASGDSFALSLAVYDENPWTGLGESWDDNDCESDDEPDDFANTYQADDGRLDLEVKDDTVTGTLEDGELDDLDGDDQGDFTLSFSATRCPLEVEKLTELSCLLEVVYGPNLGVTGTAFTPRPDNVAACQSAQAVLDAAYEECSTPDALRVDLSCSAFANNVLDCTDYFAGVRDSAECGLILVNFEYGPACH